MDVTGFDPQKNAVTVEGADVKAFVTLCAHMFKRMNGNAGGNVVEVRLQSPEGEDFTLTFQRVTGKTPMQLLDEEKAKTAELQALLTEANRLLGISLE